MDGFYRDKASEGAMLAAQDRNDATGEAKEIE
jgi:hypothetical protein